MKEQELRRELQHLYGSIPPETHCAFMDALVQIERKRHTMKKIVFTPVIALILALSLGTVAFATTTQVLKWYYENRFENYPADERSAVLENVQSEVLQQQDDNAGFFAVVQEYAWVAEKGRLVVTMNVAAKDPEIELHPMWNLDPDGSYVGGELPETTSDGEDRSEHWLWTEKGFGKVEEMMDDPAKALHLVDLHMAQLGTHEDSRELVTGGSVDAFRQADGSVQFVLEFNLRDSLSERQEDEYRQRLSADIAEKQIERIKATREIILNCDGKLNISIPYYTVAYTSDDTLLYVEGRQQHWVDVTLNIGEIPADYFK